MHATQPCALTDSELEQILSGKRSCPTLFDLDRLQQAVARKVVLSRREAWVERHLGRCPECKKQYEDLYMLDKAAVAASEQVVGDRLTNPHPEPAARVPVVA